MRLNSLLLLRVSCQRKLASRKAFLDVSVSWHDTTLARENGFTLIEILIVMLIMGIVLSIALLSISHNRKKELEDTTATLIHMLTLLETESLLRPATLGLSFTPKGYQFLIVDDKNTWQPFTEPPFSFHAFPKTLRTVLKMQNKDTPHIIISENGDLTPFTLLLYDQDQIYSIKGYANGEVRRDVVTD